MRTHIVMDRHLQATLLGTPVYLLFHTIIQLVLTGLSILDTAMHLGFSHIRVSWVYTGWCEKQKTADQQAEKPC